MTTIEEQYAAFNDAEIWEPRFAAGDIPAPMRFVIDEPLYTGTLWSVSRWARLQNEERAREGKIDENGAILVKKRTVTTTTWEAVSFAELDESLAS